MSSPCVDVERLDEFAWLTSSSLKVHSSLAARKNSMYKACVFALWILYWEQGFQCISCAVKEAVLIQTLVDAFWQSYQKIHAEEFLLEQLERIVKGSEEPTQLAIDELEMNETCVATAYAFHVPGNLGRTSRSRSLRRE